MALRPSDSKVVAARRAELPQRGNLPEGLKQFETSSRGLDRVGSATLLPRATMTTYAKDARIIICGAGCFGLSTAYALLGRGFTNITLLERSPVHPAPDAASTDINKIVRSAYSDPVYCALAREAIELWKDRSVWGDVYRE